MAQRPNNNNLVLFLSSATASQKNLAQGTATWNMTPALYFKSGGVRLALHDGSITNFFVNIITGTNDTFFYTDNIGVPDKFAVVIQSGDYSVSELSDAINLGVVNNGHTSGLITLQADYSTGKVIMSITLAGYMVYFKPNVSPYTLLGFLSAETVPNGALTTGTYSQYSDNQATFDAVQAINIKTSLTNNSLFSGSQSSIIATITPNVDIGSIQRFEPINLIWIDAFELSGSTVNAITISLTNQNDLPVDMSTDFVVTLLISMD